MHVFESGGHGFGLGAPGRPEAQWPTLLLDWGRQARLVPQRSARMSVETARPKTRFSLSADAIVLAFAAAALLVHLAAGGHYGYFTDELYYLACAATWPGAMSTSRP